MLSYDNTVPFWEILSSFFLYVICRLSNSESVFTYASSVSYYDCIAFFLPVYNYTLYIIY